MSKPSNRSALSLIEKLNKICGDENVITDNDSILSKGFQEVLQVQVVVTPGSAEEIKNIVLLALESDWKLLPVGGGTQLRQVLTPGKGGIGLCLNRLDKVLEFEPDNLCIIVEAGVTSDTISKLVAEKNLQLPIFSDTPRSTIGGKTASNFSSWKRYRYGSMEDYVLGLTFVTPTGKIVKTGGKTVKNVSGYDFTKLLGGSWGTMGILYSIILKLLPRPEKEILLTRSFDSLTKGLHVGAKILENKSKISSCNLFCHQNGSASDKFTMLVSFDGSNDFVASELKGFDRDNTFHQVKSEAVAEIKKSYADLRKRLKSTFFNTVVYGRKAFPDAAEALEFIHLQGCVFDMDLAAGILEFSALEPVKGQKGQFWQEWERIRGKYPDHASKFTSENYGQPLLDRLLPVIDPKQVMFRNNVFIGRPDHGKRI
ncbi:MAG: FAD-binding oxidoreductase [Desulfobacterium sp.]